MTGGPAREPEIALVLSPDAWVDRLHRHCADHGGARVRCIVVEPRAVLDEEFDVLVTSERWPPLTRPLVDALRNRNRAVLVVCDDVSERRPAFVTELGVDGIVGAEAAPAEIVDAILAVVPAREPARPASAGPPGPRPQGSAVPELMAVGGPFGAGSTEIAVALAAASARRGAPVVLVDGDAATPSVAVRLGLPLEPNLCGAVDAVAYGLGAVPGACFDLGDGWPTVLVGAPSPAAAAALRATDVIAVSEVLAARFRPVIVDVAAGARADGSSADLAAALIARAAAVVAVGVASPVGVVRLAEWLSRHGPGAAGPIQVVVNRAPGSRRRRAEVTEELLGSARVGGVTFVPTDPRVEEAAWDADVPDRGPFARAVAALLDVLEPAMGAPPSGKGSR